MLESSTRSSCSASTYSIAGKAYSNIRCHSTSSIGSLFRKKGSFSRNLSCRRLIAGAVFVYLCSVLSIWQNSWYHMISIFIPSTRFALGSWLRMHDGPPLPGADFQLGNLQWDTLTCQLIFSSCELVSVSYKLSVDFCQLRADNCRTSNCRLVYWNEHWQISSC